VPASTTQVRSQNVSFQNKTGSQKGSVKSKQDDEDDLDALLNNIDGGDKKPSPNNSRLSPYQAVKKIDDDLGWGVAENKSPSVGAFSKNSKPLSQGKKLNTDELVDNILDDIEEKKGISTKTRPKTANEPLWSASRKEPKDDLDLLDENALDSSAAGYLKSTDPH